MNETYWENLAKAAYDKHVETLGDKYNFPAWGDLAETNKQGWVEVVKLVCDKSRSPIDSRAAISLRNNPEWPKIMKTVLSGV